MLSTFFVTQAKKAIDFLPVISERVGVMRMLPNLSSPLLASTPHAFFLRQGGVSEGIYTSLNAGVGSADSFNHVEENRTRLATFFGVRAESLLTLKQVHSAICITLDSRFNRSDRPEADAWVTRERGVVLGILTADCVPVLLHDKEAGVIGAAHAGWKGAFAGVIQETVRAMQQLGAQPASIRAAIGPSIAVQSYEVDAAFRDTFTKRDPSWARFFYPSSAHPQTHYLFDNKSFVHEMLSKTGVTQCDVLPHDTYALEDDFYSFRRATHRSEVDYGRQLSAIMLS
jgi:polyphenol oxidase